MKLEMEGVDFLHATIAHQEYGVIRSEAAPVGPVISDHRKIFEGSDSFQFSIFNPYSNYLSGTVLRSLHVDVSSVVRPFVVAKYPAGRQL